MITDQMKAEGWIEHDGGPCPVDGNVSVRIRLRHNDGEEWERIPSDSAEWFGIMGWWEGHGTHNRIVAYKPEGTTNDQ